MDIHVTWTKVKVKLAFTPNVNHDHLFLELLNTVLLLPLENSLLYYLLQERL